MDPQAAALQLQHSHTDHSGDIAPAQSLLLLKQPQSALVHLRHRGLAQDVCCVCEHNYGVQNMDMQEACRLSR